jgi:class 3 adenylate cyclase
VRNANNKTDIAAEKACAEELLDNLLPAPIAEELKRSGKVQPESARSATILFADFQGFTILAEQAEPAALVDLLDQYCIEAKHEPAYQMYFLNRLRQELSHDGVRRLPN